MTSPAEALNEAQLIDRVRGNDAAAFAELRRRHQTDAIRTARMVAHDPDEAERLAAATFDRLHAELAAGHAPHNAVSPYLRTMIRRATLDAHRTPGGEHEPVDPAAVEGLPSVADPLAAVEERDVIREAYESLPERWQRALWFTEIESRAPAALVPDLGSAAGAVAAMAYRAREGLRQAYLAVHMSVAVSAACQPVVAKLPAYVREALSPEDDVTVAIHLDTCVECRDRRYELLLLVSNLPSVLAPALLGFRTPAPGATRPVAGLDGAAAAGTVKAAGRAARTSAVAAVAAGCVLAAAALAWAASSAFAPTMPADAAGSAGGGDPLTVTFEQTEEPPPAATLNPLDLLDGVPAEADDSDETAEPEPGSAVDESRAGEPGAGEEPATSTDSGDNTSGDAPEDSSTTGSAGGGAAAGADGGSSGDGVGDGGNDGPSHGSDSGPDEQPAPPAGEDGDSGDAADEPTTEPDDNPDEEAQEEPGLLDQILDLLW